MALHMADVTSDFTFGVLVVVLSWSVLSTSFPSPLSVLFSLTLKVFHFQLIDLGLPCGGIHNGKRGFEVATA